MKLYIFIIMIISLILSGCDSKKAVNNNISTNKNPATGLIIIPDGLACDDVRLSVDEEKTDRNTFFYGETFYLNFNNMEGFDKVDDTVFPGISLKVVNEEGDTILKKNDIYADSVNGFNVSPLLLKAKFTVEKPVHSNHSYTILIKIWDKLGDGAILAEKHFSVIENERISIEKKYISCDEIYLFSANRDKVITDNIISFDEVVYLVFDGLSGFFEEDGKIYPGSAVRAVDNLNLPIMYYDDLFKAYTTTGVNSDDFKERIYVKMAFTGVKVENPIYCEAIIYDKKRESAYIKVNTDLNVQQ